MSLQALLWDVDGTLAETERDGHRPAFNQAFADLGLRWHWGVARYGELLAVTGGRERLLHDMASHADAPTSATERDALARALHQRKNQRYAERVAAGGIVLRDGVLALMQACRAAGMRMAITTTTSRDNVNALLRSQLGPDWRSGFDAVVCGEDVGRKKPDPEVFTTALHRLGLGPQQALALEDSPAGVAAARAAGLAVVVTRSAYFSGGDFSGALAVGPDLGRRDGWSPPPPGLPARPGVPPSNHITLADLQHWHRLAHPIPTR